MPRVEVAENVVLDGVIIDKNVRVNKGVKLISSDENPVIIEKNRVIGGVYKSNVKSIIYCLRMHTFCENRRIR